MRSHLNVAAEPRFFPGASLQSRALGLGLRYAVRPVLDVWARVPFLLFPPNLLDQVARLLPAPEGTRWRAVDLPDAPAEWIHGPGTADDTASGDNSTASGAILYFHGGAFLTCGLNTHRNLVSRISAASGQPVLNVGYRQLPHAPVAESVEDGVAGFRWLLDQGFRAEDITIAGDSAGGYLAFSVARAVMDAGIDRPAGIVALSPLLDFDPRGKSEHRNADRCQAFSHRAVARLTDAVHHIDTRRGIQGQRICPVNMPLHDMPPALIHIGSREILMADAEMMANRLVSAGVPCDLHIWDRQVHVFQAAASWVPEARAAIDEIGTFIRHLEGAQVTARPARRSTPTDLARAAVDALG